MNDENAFGILVSYFTLEDDEYGLEREEFVERFRTFRDTLRGALKELPLGRDVRALDLGHAQYFEISAGEQAESPLGWAKKVRRRLEEAGFVTMAVVTHGGRWVDEAADSFLSTEHIGDAGFVTLSNPSEPMRRAFHADTASQLNDADEEDGSASGWGPGLYLDTEAAEALGITPKNSPTVLTVAGAGFYRAGK